MTTVAWYVGKTTDEEILDFLNKHMDRSLVVTIDRAARHGQEKIVDFFLKYAPTRELQKTCLERAAFYGLVGPFRTLTGSLDKYVYYLAAWSGNVDLLNLLWAKDREVVRSAGFLITYVAAVQGNVGLLEWCQHHECLFLSDTLQTAMYSHQPQVVEWLLANVPSLPFELEDVELAVLLGRIDYLELFTRYDKWKSIFNFFQGNLIQAVIRANSVPILRYLVTQMPMFHFPHNFLSMVMCRKNDDMAVAYVTEFAQSIRTHDLQLVLDIRLTEGIPIIAAMLPKLQGVALPVLYETIRLLFVQRYMNYVTQFLERFAPKWLQSDYTNKFETLFVQLQTICSHIIQIPPHLFVCEIWNFL